MSGFPTLIFPGNFKTYIYQKLWDPAQFSGHNPRHHLGKNDIWVVLFRKFIFIFLRMEQVNNKYKDLALITYKSAVLAALRVHIFLQEKFIKIQFVSLLYLCCQT